MTEAWSLYHFEQHARACRDCYDPYEVLRAGRCLCRAGHFLAHDVTSHVCYHDGDIYSTTTEQHRLIRAEVPVTYQHLRGLLRSLARFVPEDSRSPVITSEHRMPDEHRDRREKPKKKTTNAMNSRGGCSSVVVETGRSIIEDNARLRRDRELRSETHHRKNKHHASDCAGLQEALYGEGRGRRAAYWH